MQRHHLARRLALSLAVGAALCAREAPAIDLMGVYGLARENDPSYLESGAAHEAALEKTPQARAQLLPQIDANAAYTQTESSRKPPGNPWTKITSESLALTIRQPVYRRDLLVNLKQAKSQVAKADVDYAFSLQALMLRVAGAYFAVLNAIDNLRFARANKEAISEQLKQAQQRFDVGLIAITGVEEAKARHDLAVSTEIAAENQLNDSLENLREIIGVYYDEGRLASLGDDMPLVVPAPDDIDRWTRIALEQNLQMASASYVVTIAQDQIELNRSGHYPSLTLVGLGTATDSSKSRLGFDVSETEDLSLGLQLSVPIYSGGLVTSQTREARAQYRQALSAYEQSRRTVQRQTRQSFTGVKSGIARVRALRQAVVSNKSALDAVRAGFQVGTRTSVDVLDAQGDVFLAEFQYAQARYDYIIDILTLKQAAGTLSEEDLRTVNGWLEDPEQPH